MQFGAIDFSLRYIFDWEQSIKKARQNSPAFKYGDAEKSKRKRAPDIKLRRYTKVHYNKRLIVMGPLNRGIL